MMQKRKNPNDNQTKTRNPEKKYVGVRQRPSGRWVAEIKDTIQKIRVWLGTYDTAEAAARAYDEAACILRGPHTRTNFWPPSDSPSALPPKISNQLLLMLKSKSATKTVNRGFRGSEIDSSVGQSPISNSIVAPFSAPCSIIDFSSYLPDDGTKLDCFEQNLYVPTMYSTSPPIYSGGGGDWTEGEEIDVRDFMFVDEMEGLFGGDFSAFEVAEEIATEEVEEEEPVMKRMKYERRVSASLYALNGVSECLKLKGELGGNGLEELKRSCDRKMKVMLEDEEKLRPVEQLDDSSSSSSPSLCSYSSSSFFGGDEDLMSLWTFLDLPPICGGER